MILQVSAPAKRSGAVGEAHFTAGIVLKNGRCVAAAPILAWAVNRDEDNLRAYFKKRRWAVIALRER
jgi:hypothetical protein